MKILVTSIIDPRVAAYSRMHNFLEHLSRKHTVQVIAIKDTWKAQHGSYGGANFPYTIHYLSGPVPILQEILSPFTVGRLLRALGDFQPDIHFSYNSLILGYAVGRELAARKIKTVYDLADDLVALTRESPQIPALLRGLAGKIAQFFLARNVALATQVVAISPVLADSLNLPKEKTIIIPNGVEFLRFRAETSLHPHKPLRLIYAGVLREWVDMEAVLRALPPDAVLRIVGGEGFLQETRNAARRVGVNKKVEFVGTVPYKEIPKHLAWADAGVIPFRSGAIGQGALPLKLFEYTAAGLPVVTSPIPEVERISGGLVTVCKTQDDWHYALARLAKEYSSKKKDALQLRSELADYDWRRLSERLEAVLVREAR